MHVIMSQQVLETPPLFAMELVFQLLSIRRNWISAKYRVTLSRPFFSPLGVIYPRLNRLFALVRIFTRSKKFLFLLHLPLVNACAIVTIFLSSVIKSTSGGKDIRILNKVSLSN